MAKNKKDISSGRSMIEMLGVLAIVGVLSVGGIAGYSKAMMTQEISELSHNIGQAIAEVHSIYFGRQRYSAEDNRYEDLTPYLTITMDHRLYFAKTTIEVQAQSLDEINDGRAFQVRLNYLPQKACVALATQNWGEGTNSAFIGIEIAGSPVFTEDAQLRVWNRCVTQGETDFNGTTGYHACRMHLPISPAIAAQYCSCGRSYNCYVGLKFQ